MEKQNFKNMIPIVRKVSSYSVNDFNVTLYQINHQYVMAFDSKEVEFNGETRAEWSHGTYFENLDDALYEFRKYLLRILVSRLINQKSDSSLFEIGFELMDNSFDHSNYYGTECYEQYKEGVELMDWLRNELEYEEN